VRASLASLLAIALCACAGAPPAPKPAAVEPRADEAVSCESAASPQAEPANVGDPIALVCLPGELSAERSASVAIATLAGERLDSQKVAEDVRKLYATGLFDAVDVWASASPKGAVVRFVAKPRPLIADVQIEGLSAIGADDAAEALALESGLPLDPFRLATGIARLEDQYRDRGYSRVKVAVEREPVAGGELVKLRVVEGARAVIQKLTFTGLTALSDKEARGELLSTPGAAYRPLALERDVLVLAAKLYDKGRLEARVQEPVLTISSDGSSVEVVIAVEEGAVYRVGKLELAGDVTPVEQRLVSLAGLKRGEVFNRSKLVQGMTAIRSRLTNGDQRSIEPETELDPRAGKVDIVLRVRRAE
jgi:outer membrane protein insertion porin family